MKTVSDSNPRKPRNALQQQSLFIKTSLESIREYDLSSAVAFLRRLVASGLLKSEEETPTEKQHESGRIRRLASIRFRSTVRFARPATALDHVELVPTSPRGTLQPVLWVNFIGLAGIQGPLPLIYTERIFRNLRAQDGAAAAFLDIFNHRIIQLSYTIQRWLPGYAPVRPEESPLGQMVLGMNGLESLYGFGARPSRCSLPSQNPTATQQMLVQTVLTFKTLFWKKVRSAAALQQVLEHYFGVRVEIRPMRGAFLTLDSPTRLGPSRGQCLTLGRDVLLGDRVWEQGHGVDIILHDLSPALYATFNKHIGGLGEQHLKRICRHFFPMTLLLRFFVSIKGSLAQPLTLGTPHHLGFNTWLGTVPERRLIEL